MIDATQLDHYMHYPVCGFCMNAWNIIYNRNRTTLSPADWVRYCRVGGCDPDVWEYIDEGTGWPDGWELGGPRGLPTGYYDLDIKLDIPEYEDRVYHKRSGDGTNEPWRTVNQRLLKLSRERSDIARGADPFDDTPLPKGPKFTSKITKVVMGNVDVTKQVKQINLDGKLHTSAVNEHQSLTLGVATTLDDPDLFD